MSVSVSILDDKSRSKLDGIVKQMTDNGETEDNIRLVVSDFKTKYSASPIDEEVKKKEAQEYLGIGLQKVASLAGLLPSSTEEKKPESQNDKIKQYVTGETTTPHNDVPVITNSIIQKPIKKTGQSIIKPVDESVDKEAKSTINGIMYGEGKDWKDPLGAIDKKVKQAKNIDEFTALNHAGDLTIASLAPSGYDAKHALENGIWGSQDNKNLTAEVLRHKAQQYDNDVSPLRNIQFSNSEDYNADQLKNAAIIAQANKDEGLKNQIESSGLSLNDPNLWMRVGREKSGQLLDEYLKNPNVHDFLTKEDNNPVLAKAFQHADKNLLNDSGQYGVAKVAGELSRHLQKIGVNDADPIFNPDTQQSRDIADARAKQLFIDDPKKLEYYEAHKDEVLSSLDKPSFFEGVAGGIKNVFGGIGNLDAIWQSRSKDIQDEWTKEATNVSADPEGLVKHIRDSGSAFGFVLGLGAGGEVLQGANVVSTPAAAQKAMIGMSVFGDALKEGEMKYKSPVKAYVNAGVNALGMMMMSDIFPASKVGKVFNEAKPELTKVAEQLSSGQITKEVARERAATVVSNAIDWGKTALKQNVTASAEWTTLTAVKQGMDKIMGLDQQSYDKYNQNDLGDTFGSFFLSNALVSGFVASGGSKSREMENKVFEAANYPQRYEQTIDAMKIKDPSIDADQMKDNLKFITEVKSKLDADGIDPINQKRFLAEALKEKVNKENIASRPESNITRRTQQEIRGSQEVQDKILNGEDVVGDEVKAGLSPQENSVIDAIKEKADLAKEPDGSMGKTIYDAVQDPNNHKQVIKELVDQSSDPEALEMNVGKKVTAAVLELPQKSEQKTTQELSVSNKITNEDFNKLKDETGAINLKTVASKLGKDLSDGDKVEFFAEKKRFGTWDKDRGLIVDDEGKPWGLTGILNDKDGYVQKITNETIPQTTEASPESNESPKAEQPGETTLSQKDFTEKGGNKIVNDKGDPYTVYHGSNEKFNEFDESKIGKNDKGFHGKGIYFALGPDQAKMYGENVEPYHISIKNPYVIEVKKSLGLNGMDIPEGHDGVIAMVDGKPSELIVRSKSQIIKAEKGGIEIPGTPMFAKTGKENSATLSIEGEQNPPEPPDENKPVAEGEEDKDATSIKNEFTRQQREHLGLRNEIPAAEKEFGKTWDEAKEKIANGTDPQDLVNELKKKARPLTDVENALLLHHQNTKEIQLNDTNEQINKAAESGNEGDLAEAKIRKARLLDELQDIYDVNKAVGTENARGLASRKMMTDRQYSLTNMLAEKRATANDGKPLTEDQQKEVEDLHKKITETQQAFDDYVKEAQEEIGKLQEKILGKPVKDKKSAAQKIRDLADKIEKSRFGKADLPGGTETQGASFDLNKAIADGMRLIADGLEKGKELLDLIKESVENFKKDNPGEDYAKYRQSLNKSLIDASITVDKKTIKEDYAGIVHDKEAFKLRAANQRAKNEADISLKKDEQKKRTTAQKVQDTFIKWQRAFKLSNPLTLGKLSMAALTRMTTDPLEQVVGGAYSSLFPKLSEGSSEGGGLNIKVQAKAMAEGFTQGIKDAADIMKKKSQGKSDLDVVFGKGGQLPPEAIEFFGSLHSAIKAPVKRFAFERSLQKRIARNIKANVDVHDPMVQTQMAMGAYKDANRAIFMQDNAVATGWQRMVHYLETVDPKTGKAPAKAVATGLQWMLPFVKVPTNIAAEIGTNIYGVPVGAAKGLHAAFTKGLENLSPDEKDVILRNLKKGTLGLAALSLGYMNPQVFGGYYQEKEKRGPNEAKPNSVKLFGVNIPAWLVESPIFQAMEIGATVRRVKDTVVKGNPKGLSEGIWAGGLGLAEHVPMIGQGIRINKLFSSATDRKYYVGELAKSTLVPAALDYIAKATDPADEGTIAGKALNPENKRKPETMLEHIESGIPGLRENVPEKVVKTFTIYPKNGHKRNATPEEFERYNNDKEQLIEQITDRLKQKGVGVDKYGDITIDIDKIRKRKSYESLTDNERADLLKRIAASAADRAKSKFNK